MRFIRSDGTRFGGFRSGVAVACRLQTRRMNCPSVKYSSLAFVNISSETISSLLEVTKARQHTYYEKIDDHRYRYEFSERRFKMINTLTVNENDAGVTLRLSTEVVCSDVIVFALALLSRPSLRRKQKADLEHLKRLLTDTETRAPG